MATSLQTYDLLKAENLPEEHARAVTLAIQSSESSVVTELRAFRAEVSARFDVLEGRVDVIDHRFDGLRDIFATKVELAETKAELVRWMFLFWVGQTAVITGVFFAAFKLFR
jgi:hypothetical protein